MRRNTAGDQIENLILEGQGFSFGIGRADILQTALLRFSLNQIEHFLSNIGRPHARDMRRKNVGDMAPARSDIKRMPALLGGSEGNQALKALPEGMWCAGQVTGGSLSEFLLDEGFVHGRSDRFSARNYTSGKKKARHISMQG